MSNALPMEPVGPPTDTDTHSSWRHRLRQAENLLTVMALAGMVALPCLDIVSRRWHGLDRFLNEFLHLPTGASMSIVQHLVLAVGMLGGALAARDGRLLSLASLNRCLRGRWQSAARLFQGTFAATTSLFLTGASVDFIRATWHLNHVLAFGIPVWTVQTLLPLGFGVIALRLIWHGGKTWRGRLIAAFGVGAVIALVRLHPVAPEHLLWPFLGALFLAALAGAPVFTLLGGLALIFLWTGGDVVAAIPLNHYRLTVNPTLPTIPLFTLAGYFLAEGGAAHRLVALFAACLGRVRGGPAIVAVLVCAFFTTFTGASGVTILALGGLLLPILVASGYQERHALGLLTGAGSLGLLFPPCLPPILYSIVASTNGGAGLRMEDLFAGGAVPGLLLLGLAAWWGIHTGPQRSIETQPFDFAAAGRAFWTAKWELLLPVVALVALFGGFATPVEAAALTALYAFVVETFLYRDLKLLSDVPRVMTEAGLLVGGVLLILGVALGFTHFLIDAQVPDQAVAWLTATVHSKWVFLLLVNLFLLVVGCLMDIFSAIVVVVPLLVPIGQAFGVNMVHLGIIFLANLELGYLTPPVGMNLFLASYRFGKPMGEIIRATLPMLAVLLLGVLLITYVPWLTTALPTWLHAKGVGQ